MRIKLDYEKYYFCHIQRERLEWDPFAISKSNAILHGIIAKDIKELYGHKIKEKSLRDVLDESTGLSETELRVAVDLRTDSWISDRAWMELEKIHLFIAEVQWNTRFKKESYIATDEELEEHNKKWEKWRESIKNPKSAKAFLRIEKNGLDILIDGNITTYRCKDGTVYKIDREMIPPHKKNFERFELIIRECAEAGLYVDKIGTVLGMNIGQKRRIIYIAKKHWFNVCLTPKSQFKTVEILRVLDEDRMFIVEKPNLYKVKSQQKSADGMVKK